jgi:hypothetical protein
VIALLNGVAEARGNVGLAVSINVLQGNEEAAGWRSVVALIGATPGVHVEHAIWGYNQMSGVSDIVSKHCGAESWGQRDAAIITRACLRFRL